MPFLNTAVLFRIQRPDIFERPVPATDNMRHLMTCDAI